METGKVVEIGYFPIVDGEMLCVAYGECCWGEDGIAPITQDFEEIGTGSTYGYYHEFDTPVHCDGCQSLIKTELTKEGYYYLLDYIFDPNCWNNTTAVWAVAWGNEINERLIRGFGEL